jgi:hypothetical protein
MKRISKVAGAIEVGGGGLIGSTRGGRAGAGHPSPDRCADEPTEVVRRPGRELPGNARQDRFNGRPAAEPAKKPIDHWR